ncbi:anti-sigma-F factor Fin, partial [Bacillus pumilus]|uniref:anti-sigma-F factor Fin n=1 Tax=Bacillus pumilus TaxID=1408 RepID=UPI0011A080EF
MPPSPIPFHYYSPHSPLNLPTLHQSPLQTQPLPFHHLTNHQTNHIISYTQNPHLHLQTISQHSQDPLQTNPHYHH